MAAVLVAADQYPYDHDEHRHEDHAHDDHPGTGQADQVQPGYAGFGARLLFAAGLALGRAPLPPQPRRRWQEQRRCGLYAEILGSFRSSTGASHRNACVAAIITPSLGRLGWL